MTRSFVIGDIHGAYRALKQCLDRSGFDYENDRLICLGDASDGWPETKACIDELLRIKNLIYVLGNHDLWTLQWMKTNEAAEVWLEQGGLATCTSYSAGIPPEHIAFFDQAVLYHSENSNLFVHAGILPGRTPEECGMRILLWDRSLYQLASQRHVEGKNVRLTSYNEIFIGHTPTPFAAPVKRCEVWMMDTGAGWSGVLSMMDIETKEVFVSDPVPDLYPNDKGRSRRA